MDHSKYLTTQIRINGQYTDKDKWTINELLTIICVQEKERSIHETPKSANMVTHNKGNGKKRKDALSKRKHLDVQMKQNGNKGKCFFYKQNGHMKKDCAKYKK